MHKYFFNFFLINLLTIAKIYVIMSYLKNTARP